MRIKLPAQTRETKSTSFVFNLTKTILQVLLMWGTFLYLIPLAVLRVEDSLGWQAYRFDPGASRFAAWALFSLCGGIGLCGGWMFVRHGNGTPLPLDTATRFIVMGPYRWVRNPMALCGILQGIAVGWMFGSIPVMVYALIGAFAWHFLARPWEEHDLLMRFGEPYQHYHDAVRNWLPRLRPYPVVVANKQGLPPLPLE